MDLSLPHKSPCVKMRDVWDRFEDYSVHFHIPARCAILEVELAIAGLQLTMACRFTTYDGWTPQVLSIRCG